MKPTVTRAEVCAVACADVWSRDGETLASPFGVVPRVGVGLAKLTSNPDLLITDGAAMLISEPLPLGADRADARVEGWMPFRRTFDVVWSGRRHAMMGATQIDRFGNSNISAIGDWHRPKVQLLGSRGVPGNTVNHAVSYWIPAHGSRVFRETVDVVSGVGTNVDRSVARFQDLRFVVSNLGVMDFRGDGGAMRLVGVHPWCTVDELQAATGFDLEVSDDLSETRLPDDAELSLMRSVLDPDGLASREVPD